MRDVVVAVETVEDCATADESALEDCADARAAKAVMRKVEMRIVAKCWSCYGWTGSGFYLWMGWKVRK